MTPQPIIGRRSPPWLWYTIVGAVVGAMVATATWYWLSAGVAPTSPPSEPIAPPWFRDVTAASGVDFTYHTGEEAGHLTILEAMGGGVALFDFDGDGLLDIFLTGGGSFDRPRTDFPADAGDYEQAVRRAPPKITGRPCRLYRNLGGWKFADVTREAGLDRPWFYTQGVTVADYDRDGWPDLLVTGYAGLALFHNEPDGKGGRCFVDATATLGAVNSQWTTSAGWADLDGDGWPDLYVCQYVDWSFANHPQCKAHVPNVPWDVCGPERFAPLTHILLRNEHGKAFRPWAEKIQSPQKGAGLGVVLADLTEDQQPDIYVANDTQPNLLYLNNRGKLQEQAAISGVAWDDRAHANGSMGVDAADYDGSGRASLWVTTFQGEQQALYRNIRGGFVYSSNVAGIGALGKMFVGFGTAFVDVDNDGWEDIAFVNGHVFQHPSGVDNRRQRPVLLHNIERTDQRFFEDIGTRGGPFFQQKALGRGLAVGDLDNDGWPDLVISHNDTPVVLLRNEAATAAPARWLGVQLVGSDRRDVVGSTVVVETNRRRLTRFAKGGGGYLSSSDRRILFGLGETEELRRVTVRWSWGQTQTWDDVAPNRYWELREGDARPHAGHHLPAQQ
jgi:hypothetical protein